MFNLENHYIVVHENNFITLLSFYFKENLTINNNVKITTVKFKSKAQVPLI